MMKKKDENNEESNNIIEVRTNKKKGIQIKLKNYWKRFYKVKKKI